MSRWPLILLAVTFITGLTTPEAAAQTSTYHVHQEAWPGGGFLQLRSTGPDTAVKTWSAAPSVGATSTVRVFNLPPDTPALGGVIPKGTTFTFTLWMRITADRGTVYPAATMTVNYAGQSPSQTLCSVRGTIALTTTLSPYTFACSVAAAIPMLSTDKLTFLSQFYTSAYNPRNGRNGGMSIEFAAEGTLNGTANSRIDMNVPPDPRITGVSPLTGLPATPITVGGANFGAAQGSSTVTVGGVAAAPTSWSTSALVLPVPAGVTHGPVRAVVNGLASNAWMYIGTWDEDACQPQVTRQALTLDDTGVSEAITVTAAPDCTWTISDPWGDWLSVSPQAGTGNATVLVSAVTNGGTLARTSGFAINGVPVGVIQKGTVGAPYFISKTLQAPTLSQTGGTATCSLIVSRPNESGTPLFVALDLYADGVRVGTSWVAGASFNLQVARTVATSSLRCVAYNVLDGFVVGETP